MEQQRETRRDTVSVLGVAIDRLDMSGAVAKIAAFVDSGRQAIAAGSSPELAHVVTANSEIIMAAKDHPDFAEILVRAALVVPDGIGPVWAARIFGDRLPERVAGIDLMGEVLAVCAERGWRPFFLGAEPGVAEEAAAAIKERYPGLEMAGSHHGYFTEAETAAVLEKIAASHADLLLVAMGAPRQEYWIAEHRDELGVPVAVGVGGSLDVWAGRSPRAPRWMREVGLEWAYRLVRQPSRVWRMRALPRFALAVLGDKFRSSGG